MNFNYLNKNISYFKCVNYSFIIDIYVNVIFARLQTLWSQIVIRSSLVKILKLIPILKIKRELITYLNGKLISWFHDAFGPSADRVR